MFSNLEKKTFTLKPKIVDVPLVNPIDKNVPLLKEEEIAEKYQAWKKTEDYDFLLKESILLRPDIQTIFIEQTLFNYYLKDVLKQPFKKSKMKAPTKEELTRVCGEVFDSEAEYKAKYPHVREIEAKNVPEGKNVFECIEVIENPLVENEIIQIEPLTIDGSNIEDKFNELSIP